MTPFITAQISAGTFAQSVAPSRITLREDGETLHYSFQFHITVSATINGAMIRIDGKDQFYCPFKTPATVSSGDTLTFTWDMP